MPSLDGTFSALSHPVRRGILAQLLKGEAPVNELGRSFPISGPALTRHLRILEGAGLIVRSRDAQRRPCRLSAGPLKEIDSWMEHYRQFWAESFDRLDDHLKKMQSAKRSRPHGKRV
jgi:DNA-binding transcriptional ArsR family regulator